MSSRFGRFFIALQEGFRRRSLGSSPRLGLIDDCDCGYLGRACPFTGLRMNRIMLWGGKREKTRGARMVRSNHSAAQWLVTMGFFPRRPAKGEGTTLDAVVMILLCGFVMAGRWFSCGLTTWDSFSLCKSARRTIGICMIVRGRGGAAACSLWRVLYIGK